MIFPLKMSFEYGHLIFQRKQGKAAKNKHKQKGGGSLQSFVETKGSEKLTARVADTMFCPAEPANVLRIQVYDEGKS